MLRMVPLPQRGRIGQRPLTTPTPSFSARSKDRLLRQFHPQHRRQVGKRLLAARHLDRVHTEPARGFAVDAEVVEIDARAGVSAKRLAHHFVNPRVGLAYPDLARSEEHTSELQSLMRISYA